MRKKKLDVVFDDNVTVRSDKLVSFIIEDADTHGKEFGKDYKATRSDVIRAALHMGLIELDKKLNEYSDNGTPAYGALRIAGLRAMLGAEK